jgi:hypothetical protein
MSLNYGKDVASTAGIWYIHAVLSAARILLMYTAEAVPLLVKQSPPGPSQSQYPMQSKAFAALNIARRVSVSAAVVFALFAPASASAQNALINFNDLGYGPPCSWSGSPTNIPAGYGGLTWGGFNTLDLTNLFGSAGCNRTAATGYSSLQTAQVGNVLGLGSGATWLSSTNPFILTSMVAGAGWQANTGLTLGFYLHGTKQATKKLTLGTHVTGATPYLLGDLYNGATDYIDFTPDYTTGTNDEFGSLAESCAGATSACVPSTYKTFFVDNLTFIAAPTGPSSQVVTPEPATVGLLAFGLLAAGLVARKRRTL